MVHFLLAHIGVPFLAGLVLVVFRLAARQNPSSDWSEFHELAIDLAILSIGANGAIFVNPKLIEHWSDKTPVYGIVVVLLNLLLAAIVVLRGRWRSRVEFWQGVFDLLFGAIALSLTTGVFYSGYHD